MRSLDPAVGAVIQAQHREFSLASKLHASLRLFACLLVGRFCPRQGLALSWGYGFPCAINLGRFQPAHLSPYRHLHSSGFVCIIYMRISLPMLILRVPACIDIHSCGDSRRDSAFFDIVRPVGGGGMYF